MIQHLTSVEVHNRSEVFALSLFDSNKIISVGSDSCVRMWDLRSLENQMSQQFNHTYLTSICSTPQSLIVGNGEGQLLFLDRSTLLPHRTIKIHEDCINDIKIFENEVVTVSSDGCLSIFDLKTNKQIQRVDVGSPINQVEKFNGKYYLGGVRSFQVNSQFKIKKCSEVSRFLATSNRLFGTSDQKGFFGLTPKFNTYVPCENMIQFNKGILGTSWSTVSYFSVYENDDRISYRSMFLKEMEEGQSFTGLASMGKRVFAGSECGKIYAFSVNDEYHCYD